MDDYTRARPDVFFTGRDGSLRSNRVLCQLAGQYAVDAFIGSTLQIDGDANSSTVTAGRIAGFGGAPNMGHDPHGRRHASPAWLDLKTDPSPTARGKKLVVQTVETFQKGDVPAFVETLDAVEVGKKAGMPIAPVMIYGDDVSHIVTEEGIAYLYKAEGIEERRRALAAVAGISPIGLRAKPQETAELRKRGIVAYPEDIGVHRLQATRSLLAARSMEDLVALLLAAFAFGHEHRSGDGVPLALRTPYPEVARLPVTCPPAASTVPTAPRYPRLDLDATATVVDDVV